MKAILLYLAKLSSNPAAIKLKIAYPAEIQEQMLNVSYEGLQERKF